MGNLFLCGGLDSIKGHWEITPRRSKPERCFSFLEMQSRQQVGRQSWPPGEVGSDMLAVEGHLCSGAALGFAGILPIQAALQPLQESVSKPDCKNSCCIRVKWKFHCVYTDWNDKTLLEQTLEMKASTGYEALLPGVEENHLSI